MLTGTPVPLLLLLRAHMRLACRSARVRGVGWDSWGAGLWEGQFELGPLLAARCAARAWQQRQRGRHAADPRLLDSHMPHATAAASLLYCAPAERKTSEVVKLGASHSFFAFVQGVLPQHFDILNQR